MSLDRSAGSPDLPVSDDGARHLVLGTDGILSLRVDEAHAHLVRGLHALHDVRARAAPLSVALRQTTVTSALEPGAPPVLAVGPVRAFQDDALILLHSSHARGTIDLRQGTAELDVSDEAGASSDEPVTMLNIAMALLLTTVGRALVHAGAVVSPSGETWIVVGDTGSGKSSTCASLIGAGWDVLSDDQIVLARKDETVLAETWRQEIHLDTGWGTGLPTGERATVDPKTLGAGRFERQGRVSGILLPHIDAQSPTAMTTASAATALAALVRQSPWFMVDSLIAPQVLALLRETAARPAFALRLGLDSYGDSERLASFFPVGTSAS